MKVLNGFEESTVIEHRFLRNRVGLSAQMLTQQTIAQTGDSAPYAFVTARFDRDIAFGVETHRAIAEVSRAHAAQLIIDDHHLAVNVEQMRRLQIRHVRIVEPVVATGIRLLQLLVQP